MKAIDLRSDTVTKPSAQMRNVMARAEVGDDVFGDDPTVIKLEAMAAEMLGFEAGLFVSSGTQGNLVSLLSHCRRGDEFIVGQLAHNYKYEAGGGAMFGGIWPQPLDLNPDGTFDFSVVRRFIKEDDCHFAQTKLLSIENTYHGLALPYEYMVTARAFADEHRLKVHLDGARLFNAAVKLRIPARQLAGCADSVSFCLSKGLGAPVGSVVCGSGDFIKQARRYRKALGGGMRQVGIIAAAGIHALTNNIQRLDQDHANASLIAEGLSGIDGITVDNNPMQTNMVFFTMHEDRAAELVSFLKQHGILILGGNPIRIVTHLDVDTHDCTVAVDKIKGFFRRSR